MVKGLRSSNARRSAGLLLAQLRMLAEHASALATAVRVETDRGVREAMFTSLARIGSSESIDTLFACLRSDDASLRSGALDALRPRPSRPFALGYQSLLSDADSDVRLLSCELARSLPSDEATQMLAELLARETDANAVCSGDQTSWLRRTSPSAARARRL